MVLTGENRSTGEQTCHNATLCTKNLTWSGLGSNPGLRGERLAIDRLLKLSLQLTVALVHCDSHMCSAEARQTETSCIYVIRQGGLYKAGFHLGQELEGNKRCFKSF